LSFLIHLTCTSGLFILLNFFILQQEWRSGEGLLAGQVVPVLQVWEEDGSQLGFYDSQEDEPLHRNIYRGA